MLLTHSERSQDEDSTSSLSAADTVPGVAGDPLLQCDPSLQCDPVSRLTALAF